MIEPIKSYFNAQLKLAKLEGIETMSRMISKGIYMLLIFLFLFFFVLILSLACGYFLSEWLGIGYGFLIVSGFYFLLLLFFWILKKPIRLALQNMAIEAAMSKTNSPENGSQDS